MHACTHTPTQMHVCTHTHTHTHTGHTHTQATHTLQIHASQVYYMLWQKRFKSVADCSTVTVRDQVDGRRHTDQKTRDEQMEDKGANCHQMWLAGKTEWEQEVSETGRGLAVQGNDTLPTPVVVYSPDHCQTCLINTIQVQTLAEGKLCIQMAEEKMFLILHFQGRYSCAGINTVNTINVVYWEDVFMQVLIIILFVSFIFNVLWSRGFLFVCFIFTAQPTAQVVQGISQANPITASHTTRARFAAHAATCHSHPLRTKLYFHYVLRFAHAAKYHSHMYPLCTISTNCIFSMCYILPMQQNTTHTPIMYKVVFSVCVTVCPYSKIPLTCIPIMYKVVFSVCVTFCPYSKIPLTHPLCTKLYFQYVLHFAHVAKYHSHTHYVQSCIFSMCYSLPIQQNTTHMCTYYV